MTQKQKHPLWNKSFPKLDNFFGCYYYDGAAGDIADTDEGVIDIVIEELGKNTIKKIGIELKEIIDSNMEDEELQNFIHQKLGSSYFAALGESQNWLEYIYDYIKKVGCFEKNLTEEKHPLWDKPMYDAHSFFAYYYWKLPKEIAPEDAENYKFIDWNDKDSIKAALDQIKKMIDSDISDKELRDFAHEELSIPFFTDPKDTRIWLMDVYQYIQKHHSFSTDAIDIKKNRHSLYDQNMSEARLFFTVFYRNKEAGETLEEYLNSFIKWESLHSANMMKSSLEQILQSDMNDAEIDIFFKEKLGADVAADRELLMSAKDFIQVHLDARPIRDRLYDADMTELTTYFSEYYSNSLNNVDL